MANTLTNLIPTVYSALDTVSRELVGMLPAVRRNTGVERASKDQTIRFPIVPQGSLEDITPGQLPADSGSQTIGSDTMTISKSRAYPILWNGEEENSVNAGADVNQIDPIQRDQFAQGFRTLVNEMESDLAALYAGASRANGTAGTLPFGTINDLSDFAEARRILNENGAPSGDLHLILGNASAANLRGTQATLFRVNESGTDSMLRMGELGRVMNFAIGESNQIAGHTKGDGSGFVTDLGATLPVGSTTIHVDTGINEIVAGDVVTFAGDSNKYIVTVGHDAGAGATEGDIVIAEPGLRQTLADGVNVTIGDSTNESNLYFDRNAIVLANRLPLIPAGGDGADDRMVITDPFTGLNFEMAVYRQYRQVKIEIAAAWGVKMVKPAHAGVLLG